MSHLEDSVLDAPAQVVAAPATQVHGVIGEFDSPEALLDAVRAARGRGYTRIEAYSPFPIHGLDQAMGEKRSRLGYIVLICGILGAAFALLMQWWTGAVSYPLVIGGKPFFAFEFSIPVTFELTVLFSAFGAVIGMFAINGLPRLHHPVFEYSRYRGATDDRFLLAIEASDPKFDADDAYELMAAMGAGETEVVEA